jgi:shikimate kinase
VPNSEQKMKREQPATPGLQGPVSAAQCMLRLPCPPSNIILIGYRATGKTTLARLLAERLAWSWIDADVEIERRAGKSIAQIFAEEGEPVFRQLEAQVIAELCRQRRLVLAAGGGAPLRSDSRQQMRESGQVVCLLAQPETILQRMSADASTAARRPNLTDKGPLEEIIQLLKAREPIYRESAHLVIDTEGKSPREIADEILDELQLPPPAEKPV